MMIILACLGTEQHAFHQLHALSTGLKVNTIEAINDVLSSTIRNTLPVILHCVSKHQSATCLLLEFNRNRSCAATDDG